MKESPALAPLSLRTLNRPLLGGLQIATEAGICTLGFIARRASVWGFVTNAHCTSRIGRVDRDIVVQPDGQDLVGHETADPGEFVGPPCPSTCRYADAAFIKSDLTALQLDRARIADPGSGVSWDRLAKYRVVKEEGTFVNETVVKVGRTTGETKANVSVSCADYVEWDPYIVFLCQGESDNLIAKPGDSGSPVFQRKGEDDVALKGLLWGGHDGRFAIWSLIANIQRSTELGPMQDCAAGFAC